jgi:hypothetical protein
VDPKALEQLERHLAGVNPDTAAEAAVSFLKERDADFLWRLVVDAGERHTEDTGEEHIIGDLEDALQTALRLLTPPQREQFIRAVLAANTVLESALEDAGGDDGEA